MDVQQVKISPNLESTHSEKKTVAAPSKQHAQNQPAETISENDTLMMDLSELDSHSSAINHLFDQLQQLLRAHSYPELRDLDVKTDGQKLFVFGNLSTYYLKQILVSSTRQIRNHITVEHEVVIRDIE